MIFLIIMNWGIAFQHLIKIIFFDYIRTNVTINNIKQSNLHSTQRRGEQKILRRKQQQQKEKPYA